MRVTLKRSILTLLAAGALLVSGVAEAKEPGQKQKRSPEERAAMFEKRFTEKLGPELGLDEAKSKELAAIFKASAEKKRAAKKEVKAERAKLKSLIESKASAKELDQQRANVEAAVERVPRQHELLAETGRILNAEQQAKLTLRLSKGERGGPGHHPGKKGPGGHRGKGPRAEAPAKGQ